jgi:hypothetical protein
LEGIRKASEIIVGPARSTSAGQFTALYQLGTNNVPADAEQPGGLNLIAMTELIGCLRDCRIDFGIKVRTVVFKKCQ